MLSTAELTGLSQGPPDGVMEKKWYLDRELSNELFQVSRVRVRVWVWVRVRVALSNVNVYFWIVSWGIMNFNLSWHGQVVIEQG